jgi:hypothetical protein
VGANISRKGRDNNSKDRNPMEWAPVRA